MITDEGTEIECPVLLDSGSQAKIIAEKIVNRLKVTTRVDKMTFQVSDNRKDSKTEESPLN